MQFDCQITTVKHIQSHEVIKAPQSSSESDSTRGYKVEQFMNEWIKLVCIRGEEDPAAPAVSSSSFTVFS